MWTVGDAAHPHHGVGVLGHGDDGLGGEAVLFILLPQTQRAELRGQGIEEQLVPRELGVRFHILYSNRISKNIFVEHSRDSRNMKKTRISHIYISIESLR